MTDNEDSRISSSEFRSVRDTLEALSSSQFDVIKLILNRFEDEAVGELCRDDFFAQDDWEYFAVRLAAHHAFSTTVMKKENFEHILEEVFTRKKIVTKRADSMTHRGADLTVGGITLSLKTEAAKGLKHGYITISKLMEAAWIKQMENVSDIPGFIASKVMPHFDNYDRIYIMRSYVDGERSAHVRYDLREIPKDLLLRIGDLQGSDFKKPTKTKTTSANVSVNGRRAFTFSLDGSDDKLTIRNLDIDFCPLHAWWSLSSEGLTR
ncbi:MAG: hypothetical protein ABJP02_10445 [Parasphingorhabdus sp.]|uniref:hypothetical protein n=1 Tax=Parasphingorhabdus sp. TaxID=2709688 RepID=UPI0032699290